MALVGDVHGEAGSAEVLRSGDNPLEGVATLLQAPDIALVAARSPGDSACH